MAEKANMAVKLDAAIRDRLKALGQAKRRSAHWLMVEAIRLYVEREEEQERRKRESMAALAHYDATGEYVDDADVRAWLKSWGRPDELAPPRVRKRSQ